MSKPTGGWSTVVICPILIGWDQAMMDLSYAAGPQHYLHVISTGQGCESSRSTFRNRNFLRVRRLQYIRKFCANCVLQATNTRKACEFRAACKRWTRKTPRGTWLTHNVGSQNLVPPLKMTPLRMFLGALLTVLLTFLFTEGCYRETGTVATCRILV